MPAFWAAIISDKYERLELEEESTTYLNTVLQTKPCLECHAPVSRFYGV